MINDLIFSGLRLIFGATGALWVLGAIIGSIRASLDGAYEVVPAALLLGCVGYAMAYGAFVRFPWEARRAGVRETAAVTKSAESSATTS